MTTVTKAVAYCPKHRSHFCPCVAPDHYHDATAERAKWDTAEQKYRQKRAARPLPRPRKRAA